MEQLTARCPGTGVQDAYRVQAALIGCRTAAGARVVGYKIGVTSQAMQRQMRVYEPDYGVLLDDMVLPDGSALATSGLLNPRVEAEIAVRLGRDLHTPHISVDAARDAVAEVLLALEVIDTRYTADWQITLADSVADNASCARAVVGEPVDFTSGWDLRDEHLTVDIGGRTAAAGEGRAVLGDPLRALAWVAARHSAGGGPGLRAGSLVLTGAVHASLPLASGTTVSARVTSRTLPPVRLHAR
ncbi:2-keto-4-pentenoate hydratase [Streptomyces finlayi]|uniref:2-keto-4-pentenoate hydratase n=1 Tax=Streptomyces finlayi TaxID=67296 RepID=UPI001E5B8A54|nr:fumarylacetoacetate hydrolase family protein [Streptomyces finlayi]